MDWCTLLLLEDMRLAFHLLRSICLDTVRLVMKSKSAFSNHASPGSTDVEEQDAQVQTSTLCTVWSVVDATLNPSCDAFVRCGNFDSPAPQCSSVFGCKLNHLQREGCETLPPPVWTGVQGALLISAHTETRTFPGCLRCHVTRLARAMNIIMKIDGRRRQRGCARHKDGCEARSTTSIVLLRSARFSTTCYCTASLMIAAEMTPAVALDALGTAQLASVFEAGVDRCEELVFSFNGKERGNLARRRKTFVRIAAPRHNFEQQPQAM